MDKVIEKLEDHISNLSSDMNVADDDEIDDLKKEQDQFVYALDLLESLNSIINKNKLKEKKNDLKSFYNWLIENRKFNDDDNVELKVHNFLSRKEL